MKPQWSRQHAAAGAVLVMSALAFATMTLPHIGRVNSIARSAEAALLCASIVIACIGAYAIVRGMRAPV
jgi:hypothetical protein